MGKYFEISYTPEQFDPSTGGAMPGAYGGINVQQPENIIQPQYFPRLDDFDIRNQEIRSRPNFNATFIAPPDTNYILGIAPGFGPNAGTSGPYKVNLVAFTVGGVWRWDGTVWNLVLAGATNVGSQFSLFVPMSWRVFQNKLYFTNASNHTYVWDGLSDTSITPDIISITGGVTVGAIVIDELDNHLIVANTSETAGAQPWRVRWSANGLPLVWDPTVNVNAGLADFLEVPDQITGAIMMGRVGYILRSNGITEIAPTGNGVAPFDFNHLWASQVGIGNIIPFATGQYGPVGMIVSNDNIYQLMASGFNPVGGVARDAIMADIGVQDFHLGPNSGGPSVMGFLTPYLVGQSAESQNVNPGTYMPYPFFTYMLFIRIPGNNTRIWIYNLEDRSWIRWTIPNLWVTARPIIAPAGTVTGNAIMLIPWQTATGTGIGAFVTSNFNDPIQGSSYAYRIEDVDINRYPTVRRVILTYRDLGKATITVTLTGTNDNAQIVSNSVTIFIGNTVPTNTLITRLVDLTLSAFRPQLSISRAANGGPVSITRATILGESEEVTL